MILSPSIIDSIINFHIEDHVELGSRDSGEGHEEHTVHDGLGNLGTPKSLKSNRDKGKTHPGIDDKVLFSQRTTPLYFIQTIPVDKLLRLDHLDSKSFSSVTTIHIPPTLLLFILL